MFNMNIEWDNQQPAGKGYRRHHQPQPESKGLFGGLFGTKKEEDRHAGHVYYYSQFQSRPNAPRRAETISVLPAGVKMPTGDKPEVSYGADGSKYLVIPPKRSNSSSRPRQIIVTSGNSTPKRKDSTASSHQRATPRRSNSSARPTSPPAAGSHRTPKIVGDPELVKQYEHSQRNVARWVESMGDTTSSTRRPGQSKRTTTR